MKKPLEGKKVLMFIDALFEEMELLYPRYRLIEAGAKVVLAGPKAKEAYPGKHGFPYHSDIAFQDAKEGEYAGLLIPGGYAPDRLRRNSTVLELVKQFHKNEKPIAIICHAGWVPISAQVIKGVRCTSFSAIKDDMVNAGAKWVDEAVVVDKNIISSRSPDDLPVFCPAFIEAMVRS